MDQPLSSLYRLKDNRVSVYNPVFHPELIKDSA
jgi:hypothetical protein